MIKKYFFQSGKFTFINKATAALTLCSAVALFVFAATPALALQTGIQYGEATGLGSQDIRITIMQIVRIVLGFVGIIAILVIMYGGFVWMTSGGSAEKIDYAKRTLRNGVIGLIIIFSSLAIATFIINALIGATSGCANGICPPPDDPPTECENCWYLGGGIIESVYPTPFSRDIPRNTSIIVTFKVPMLPNTIIEGAPASCSAAAPCQGQINDNNIKIYPYEAGDNEALSSSEVTARSNDGRTFIFTPNELLGNAIQNTWYSAKLEAGIRKDNNEGAFPSGAFEWRFEVGTLVDVDPVEVSRVFPYPDLYGDVYTTSAAVPARGSIQIFGQPNIAQTANAVVVSATPGSPTATINGSYNGTYEGSVTLTAGSGNVTASWSPARSGAATSFNVTNNTITLGDGLIVSFANAPSSGNQFVISLIPQRNADTLRVGSRLYSFVVSNPNQNQIQRGANFNNTLTNIVTKINNDSLSPVTADPALNLTAKVAGTLGNTIALSASGNWANVIPMTGGTNAGVEPEVRGQPDQPRNVIITIDFNEPIDPTRINNDTVKVEYLPPCVIENIGDVFVCLLDFVNYLGPGGRKIAVEGKWEISNNYKTISFIPSTECFDDAGNSLSNACGDTLYCLPLNEDTGGEYKPTPYIVSIKAGLLRECSSDNDCTDNTFRYCLTTPGTDTALVCGNSSEESQPEALAYDPKIRTNADGISDAASNSFNGNNNELTIAGQNVGRVEGPILQSNRFGYNATIVLSEDPELESVIGQMGDDFSWFFFVNKNIKTNPPALETISPNVNSSGASITAPVEAQFGDLMMSSTLKPGSNYRDGYCGCDPSKNDGNGNNPDCSEGYRCDNSFAPARCVANDRDEQIYCQQDDDCAGTNVCLNKKYISFIDRSTSPIGWWIDKEELDTKTPRDGFANKTKALLKHTRFSEVTSYGVEIGSGVKDIYQNCYLPSEGPGVDPTQQCNVTAQKPYCCNGVAKSLSEWNASECFTKP